MYQDHRDVAKRRQVNLVISISLSEFSRSENPKVNYFFWFRPFPAMMSSQLIRLQRLLSPFSDKISKNENRTLKIVFHKLSKNIFFDFRFKIDIRITRKNTHVIQLRQPTIGEIQWCRDFIGRRPLPSRENANSMRHSPGPAEVGGPWNPEINESSLLGSP